LKNQDVCDFIVHWLTDYCNQLDTEGYGFVVGISGGIDSALTSTLCALTGKNTLLLNLPIRQNKKEYERASKHIDQLCHRFSNCSELEIDLTEIFNLFQKTIPEKVQQHGLAMANSRARLRMTTLYAVAQANKCLVVGTGNKIEDFGVGFFTKYGDGGVDISPIADLTKTEVTQLAEQLGVIKDILDAPPTDGLWEDGRVDEDQLGATYAELEWAMEFKEDENPLSQRQKDVLAIYRKFNALNLHKMTPIPVCMLPKHLKNQC
jgi:NAD+ synthase